MSDRLTVPAESAELDVVVAGRDGAGTVVTLHPTEPMDGAAPLLAEITGARVVCVNPRGIGRSSPARGPRDSTLEGMATDLELVRRALGVSRWVIWGMSGGSMVAQVFARLHPEVLDALILDSAGPCFALTLADPACVLNPSYPAWREALAAAGVPADGAAADRAGADLVWEEVPRAGWVLRRASGPAVVVSPSEPSPAMRRVMPNLIEFDARPWLGGIRVPALVMGGTADRVAPPAQLRALHEAIPGSRLAMIQGAGHVPIGEKPEVVAAEVRRFLAERSKAPA
jgi:pimeloyl-ACP methyl ester carboxylesterase